MTKPIIAPERAAFVREVFEQMRNQLEAINVNPDYFCAWLRYQSLVEGARDQVKVVKWEGAESYTILDESDNVKDAMLDDGPDACIEDVNEALAIGRCLDPDFGHDFLSDPMGQPSPPL